MAAEKPEEVPITMSTIDSQVIDQIDVAEIEQNLVTFLQRVKVGEAFLVVEAGEPIAEVKPILSTSAQMRPFGLCTGEFVVPDDFDAPLPESLLREFEGR